MKKTIKINTEPHECEVGPHTLLFQPEIYGDDFLDNYSQLQEIQKEFSGADLNEVSGTRLRGLYTEMRAFLARLMTDECADRFNRFEVHAEGKPVVAFRTREGADAHAEKIGATDRIKDESIRLPDRVLVELMEWVVELYGSGEGSGSRPTGSSSASARASSRAGTPGKGPSRSKGSTRAAGR